MELAGNTIDITKKTNRELAGKIGELLGKTRELAWIGARHMMAT